ncbi:MAG TPA: DUF2254 domain-containing protein [Gaiellaceae bacterium]|nr:DUF2254 domain-containing protein [Gaiellaceae bacterium]
MSALRRFGGSLVELQQGLWFVPALIVVLDGALSVALVEVDRHTSIGWGPLFQGDASAARTVLSVIAGSLITVAGLTFSITIVVLQLTSSQFSPRILRTFFGDRLTQVTVGSYVGIFVYSILVLRSVSGAFVPRLAVTGASALAVAAVVLLIVFIHHISQLIQVSYVTGDIAEKALVRLDALYPATHGAIDESDCGALLEKWLLERPGLVLPERPGYLRRIDLDSLAGALAEVDRAAVLVRPGDFVSVEQPLAAVWPAARSAECSAGIRKAFHVARERDLDQDLDFGLRQLTDTAVKAMSPGINDPTTATTCIGYLRSILVRLAEREFPAPLKSYPEAGLTLIVQRREFEEYLDSLLEIGRYSSKDARVTVAVLDALRSVRVVARAAGYEARAAAAAVAAIAIGTPASKAVLSDLDRDSIGGLLATFRD